MTEELGPAPRRIPNYRLSYPAASIREIGYCSWETEAADGHTVVRKRGYELNDRAFVSACCTTMPSYLADIIDVALAAYTIDRLSPRRILGQRGGGQCWQRVLEVCVPVRDVWRWENTLVRAGLQRLLGYFTDDLWVFRFVQRQGLCRHCELQGSLPFQSSHAPRAVCLFSGGLDSLAGATGEMLRSPDLQIVCVAGATNDWIGNVQASLVAGLRGRFDGRASLLKIPFHLAEPEDGYWPEETTQRARGFIHLMLGAVGSVLAGTDTLNVHENGVGAINLPYSGAQFGARMTKAMQPIALADTASWLSSYLGRRFRIVGTSLGSTKAQAAQAMVEAGLGSLATQSFSCDGFQRVAGQHQCGVCTSCLLRRQSIYASGLSGFDNPALYKFDVTNPHAEVPKEHTLGLRVMLDQLTVLRECLTARDPWMELVDNYPSLHELEARAADWQSVGGPDLPSTALPLLYATYLKEWEQFPISPKLRHGMTLARIP